jgi:large subunit ribosomal protein L10
VRLAITRERKEDLAAQYAELLDGASGLVVTEYRGMNVNQISDVRKALRQVGASYVVTKNRLLKLALDNAGLNTGGDLLTGPVAVSFARQDLPGMVKVLLDKAKENERLILKGAIIGQSVLNEADLKTLSELPSLDQLRAQILGLLTQPAQGLVSVIAAPSQGLVGVLESASYMLANVLAAYAAKDNEAA